MLTDSFFEQGTSHEVCEDYAVHGDNYAIISDGCSNYGGPKIDTDWGARILCKAAQSAMEYESIGLILDHVGRQARAVVEALPGLRPESLTATLSVLRAINGVFQATLVGDGVVGGKRKDGRWKIHVLDFKSAPFYLKYKIFGEENVYFSNRGLDYKIDTYFGHLMSQENEFKEFVPIGERYDQWAANFSMTEKAQTLNLDQPYCSFEFPMSDYEFAFVCSDGVESFFHPLRTETQKVNEPIFVLDALRVILDFVTIMPGFARLQRHWAFKQDKAGTLVRRNWKNDDDVAVGVIYG